jgi:glycosyltransferase involved in cell wall biosynthesis
VSANGCCSVPERPLVSIGVPVFNGARYLSQALESALAQEYSPIEVIISDDASSDGTEMICREFIAADPRVRYLRTSTNIGASANFKRVLDEANGLYFTWLAQDDVLTEQHYIGTVVEYLESHPDVVACATSLSILDLESPGSVTPRYIPELDPGRPWPDARREFFRWPQGYVLAALYGMYRHAELMRVPIVTRRLRGRPIAAFWEIPVLAALSRHGRIVALPDCLRGYRVSGASDGDRIHQGTSSFDLFVLGMRVKLSLLYCALRARLPFHERLDLVRTTVENLLRANFRRPWDYQTVISQRQEEIAVLYKAANERLDLISLLQAETEKRRELVRALCHNADLPSTAPTDGPQVAGADTGPQAVPRLRSQRSRRRRPLLDFFLPLPASEVALYHDLVADIAELRPFCDRQMRTIADLTATAEALLDIINAGHQ